MEFTFARIFSYFSDRSYRKGFDFAQKYLKDGGLPGQLESMIRDHLKPCPYDQGIQHALVLRECTLSVEGNNWRVIENDLGPWPSAIIADVTENKVQGNVLFVDAQKGDDTKAGTWAEPKKTIPRDENFIARGLFEADAQALGYDLTREVSIAGEPWHEYSSLETGHRWAGWLAAREQYLE